MATELESALYSGAIQSLTDKALSAGFSAPAVRGISVGGCVEAIGTERMGAFRRKAHAHNHNKDENQGWICFLASKPERVITSTGKASAILAHEYAHLMVPSAGHNERWRKAVTALGHPKEAR